MASPTVSVILNCYNHEQYVAEAIESVLNQSFSDLELILIDNGSTDGSRAVMKRYDDARIRLVLNDENASLAKRLNEGAAAAKGEFLAVLYSDDYMVPDKLERQVALFRSLPADYGVVYCPALGLNQLTGERWQHSSMGISGAMMPQTLERLARGQLDMSSPLIRLDCLRRYKWHEDLPFEGEAIFLRIAMRWKFEFDPKPTVVLRDHGLNAGKAIFRSHEAFMEVLRRLEKEPDFRPEWQSALQRLRGLASRVSAWQVLRSEPSDPSWARREFLRAIRYDPRRLVDPRLSAGLFLTMLPAVARKSANKLGDILRPSPRNKNVVAD